ncbi:MAG: universal stress protein [Azospirillum sp.]|nr:universal stress protein [Azospirillum sp.]
MALKDILVVVDGTAATAARVAAAAALAARHDAHLTGLWVVPPLNMPGYVDVQLPEAVREAHRQEQLEQTADAKRRFAEAMGQAGLTARSEWRSAQGDPTDITAIHARYADLVVVGQTDVDRGRESATVRPEALVFDSGRPVLVVPYAGQFPTVGDRVLVAWNDSREAARAVADAHPILERAHRVTVLAVNPRPGIQGAGDEPGADIARHLAHHRVTVEASHFLCEPAEIGDILLNQITDLGCDLVVMGAYGRSRLREIVLGSLTGFILRHMTVPILFSH